MNWTAKKFLNWSAGQLARAGVYSPRLESEILLAEAMNLQREDLHRDPDHALNDRELTASRKFVERRTRREPVSYILGRKEFWGLEFRVSPDVLVPRWETEILIEAFLQWIHASPWEGPLHFLDIGTGCGNIAVAVAREIPQCRVTAVDISPAALAVARENAVRHGVAERIRLVRGDMLAGAPEGPFHAILSNPPYIDTVKLESLAADIKDFEPRPALDGGAGGLHFFKRIIPGAGEHLAEGGALFLETGEDQAQAVSDLIRPHGGYGSPVIIKDYSGRDRVVSARKRGHG